MDRSTGMVSVHYANDKGEQKVEEEHTEFPPDLANGMMMPLSKNFRKDALPDSVSVVAITPKPEAPGDALHPEGGHRGAERDCGETARETAARLPHLDHGRRRPGVCPGRNADSYRRPALGARTERPCL